MREEGREESAERIPIELEPAVSVAICLSHCLDGTRTRGRHYEWYANARRCTRRGELTIFVQDTLHAQGGYDYGRGQLDAKKGSLRVNSQLSVLSKAKIDCLRRDYDGWRRAAYAERCTIAPAPRSCCDTCCRFRHCQTYTYTQLTNRGVNP